MSESYCTWMAELKVSVLSPNERETIEEFTVLGRAAEVPTPKVGENMRILGPGDEELQAKVVRCVFAGHSLMRRNNPWTWKASWEVTLRLPTASGF